MERELEVPWEDVFASIDPTPLAAGTIGQVHRATLETGERVVVKVQRPQAGEVLSDLRLLELFAEKAMQRPALRDAVDVPVLVEHLASSLRRELDFRREADNLERMAELLAPFERLGVPRVLPRALEGAAAGDGGDRRRARCATRRRRRAGRGREPAARVLLRPGARRRLLPRRSAPRQPALARRPDLLPRPRHGRRARRRAALPR